VSYFAMVYYKLVEDRIGNMTGTEEDSGCSTVEKQHMQREEISCPLLSATAQLDVVCSVEASARRWSSTHRTRLLPPMAAESLPRLIPCLYPGELGTMPGKASQASSLARGSPAWLTNHDDQGCLVNDGHCPNRRSTLNCALQLCT
jgi:hypothetical protein